MADVRQLRYFLAVADTLNFTEAAKRLMMSTSPLSRTIQQLESQVGGALFVRDPRGVMLTPLGYNLIPYAERVVNSFDLLERELLRSGGGSHPIHLGFRSVPNRVLDLMINDVVGKAQPDAVVRIHPVESHAQITQLESGRLSFGLSTIRPDGERFGWLPVFNERLAIALPATEEFAALEVVSPKHIAQLRLLVQPGMEVLLPSLRPYLSAAREVEQVRFEIVGGLAAMILHGDSCTFAAAHPEAPWYQYLNVDGVVIRPCDNTARPVTTDLIWRADRDLPHDLGPIVHRAAEVFATPLLF